jgi:hypothetical protein
VVNYFTPNTVVVNWLTIMSSATVYGETWQKKVKEIHTPLYSENILTANCMKYYFQEWVGAIEILYSIKICDRN